MKIKIIDKKYKVHIVSKSKCDTKLYVFVM